MKTMRVRTTKPTKRWGQYIIELQHPTTQKTMGYITVSNGKRRAGE